MASSFSRTLRWLANDDLRSWTLRVVAVMVLVLLWGSWFFLARVSVYAVSDKARLEVVHPLEAPVDGRITAINAGLDAEVEAGQVLFELDAEEQRYRLEEEQARLESLSEELGPLERELRSAERAGEAARSAAAASLSEARARYEKARLAAERAEKELQDRISLQQSGVVSQNAVDQARSDARQARSAAEEARQALRRLEFTHRGEESEREGEADRLRREVESLKGAIRRATAAVRRLQEEIERRRIRVPVAGRIGELSPELRVGSIVSQGESLAAIVPSGGDLKVVADFLPAAALGRIQSGQPARVRLTGFPSTQFGSIAATVSRVASEAREGRIRVELAVEPDPLSPIPLQHGLPGTVEVEIEQVSPATLVLRVAGKVLGRPTQREGFVRAQR